MKRFGGNRTLPQREQFELAYMDADENERVEQFQIVPRASGGDIAGIMQALEHNPEKSVGRLIRLLSKVMDNRDGEVKANWKPDVLPRTEGPEGEHEEARYRGPDGAIYPLSDKETLDRWSDKSLWTSRRRWNYLLVEDDDAIVEMQDLMEIAEWVISVSTDRPTQPRA